MTLDRRERLGLLPEIAPGICIGLRWHGIPADKSSGSRIVALLNGVAIFKHLTLRARRLVLRCSVVLFVWSLTLATVRAELGERNSPIVLIRPDGFPD